MKVNIFAIFLLSLVTVACGSRDIQYEEFDANVLDGLKKKKQNECLASKADIIQTWKDKWPTIHASDAMKPRQRYTIEYTSDSDSSNPQTVTVTITDRPDENTITFLVIDEDFGNTGTADEKIFTYTKTNHEEHVQLLIAEACLAESPIVSATNIEYEFDVSNKIDKYGLLDTYPAFFARYLSFTREVRTGDTTDTKGTVSKTITRSNPTVILLGSDPTTTSPTTCTFSTPIIFDPSGPPSNESSTVISLIGIRVENGYGSTCFN